MINIVLHEVLRYDWPFRSQQGTERALTPSNDSAMIDALGLVLSS
jgi:hypothetical protein